MSEKPDRPTELEALSRKVREASQLISHLRDRNRALTSELEAMKLRLAGGASGGSAEGNQDATAPGAETSSELKLLRQERQQIRDRIVHLLQQLDEISAAPAAE